MTQQNQATGFSGFDEIGDAVALMDAALTNFAEDPENANDALATVPLRELVIISTLALESVKTMAPELYQRMIEKHKLVPQDAKA